MKNEKAERFFFDDSKKQMLTKKNNGKNYIPYSSST